MGVWGKGVTEAKRSGPDAGKHAVRHDWRFCKVVRPKRDRGLGEGGGGNISGISDLMAIWVFGGSRGVKVVSFFRFFFQHVFSDVFGVMPDPKLAHN